MIVGDMQIIACPHCGALAYHWTVLSGNTLGARRWTDGHVDAPMWMRVPEIAMCHRCAQGYWVATARRVGSQDPGSFSERPDPRWSDAKELVEPDEWQCYRLMRAEFAADAWHEISLRTRAWHRSNDRWREAGPAEASGSSSQVVDGEVRENMRRLAALLDESVERDGSCENQDDVDAVGAAPDSIIGHLFDRPLSRGHDPDARRLQKAEIQRELGEFEPALRLLAGVTSDRLRPDADQISELCRSLDRNVRLLGGGEAAIDKRRANSPTSRQRRPVLSRPRPPAVGAAAMILGPAPTVDLAESTVSGDKVGAYLQTDYVVEAAPPLRLRVGEGNPALARLMAAAGVDCCAFVTACNPNGSALEVATNAERQDALRRQLEQRRLTFVPGHGRHPTNGWPPEPSYLALGLDLDGARELGRLWGQDAVVWAGADALPRLVLLR